MTDHSYRELRRSYHDRIADVRVRSQSVLHHALTGVQRATDRLFSSGAENPTPDRQEATAAASLAAEVDAEVVSLLALESPVARDLRLILAARDVTQIGLLCMGLAVALEDRSGCAERIASGSELTAIGGRVGHATIGLLRQAAQAWTGLDVVTARRLDAEAAASRSTQTEFFGSLLCLRDVPVDAVLDLGMVARAYERLADHAVEIAERVMFAVEGSPTPLRPTP